MDWGTFKQRVDEKLIDELGPGFDENSIQIDYIDTGLFIGPTIEVIKHEFNGVTLRVTD